MTRALLTFAVLCAFAFGALAFVHLEINPTAWSLHTRYLFAVLVFLAACIAAQYYELNKGKK